MLRRHLDYHKVAPLPLQIALLIATVLTGAALALFAWLTYKHSKQLTELRYSPVLQVYPVGPPRTGSFLESDCEYHGVKWEIRMINPGEVPIWAKYISIFIQVPSTLKPNEGIWSGITKLCELRDEVGNILDERALGINGCSQCKLVVYLCKEEIRKEQHKFIKAGESARMSVEFFQERGLRKGSGWVVLERSEPFVLPDKYDKGIRLPALH